MIQTERVISDECLNGGDFRGNGHIKEPSLAREAIRQAYISAYQRDWRPGRPDSAVTADLAATLAEVYEKINGRLLGQLADDSELAKIREGVIQEIKSGALERYLKRN